jgi:hypothetical protein
MKALLEAEKSQKGLHAPKGVLADPSGAMALLWIRRGLVFWARLFQIASEALSSSKSKLKKRLPLTFKDQSEAAYADTIGPFHGWISRKGFKVVMRNPPDWDELRRKARLATSREQLAADLKKIADELTKLTNTMRSMHRKYDLEDKRKSI